MPNNSEARIRANNKYNLKAYDDIKIRVSKGLKEIYKQQAESKGMSLNAYIISLLERDRAEEI